MKPPLRSALPFVPLFGLRLLYTEKARGHLKAIAPPRGGGGRPIYFPRHFFFF